MGWNIFIYGTLKKGEPNHWLIKKLRNHARFLSQAQTKEKLPLGIGLVFTTVEDQDRLQTPILRACNGYIVTF